jgi:RNA polymerase sigma factor (sigma-70 family)
MARDLHRTIDAVWRLESARIIGAIARRVCDVGLAEELAQDALVAALEHWPRDGIPDNPGAWLMATAKNRALDRLRQLNLHHAKQQELGADADARGDHVVPDFVDSLDDADDIGDDLLRLVFTACHPVLSREAQVALTLKLLAGMSTAEIARAFLQPEPTIAQRIVRAKRTLGDANVPFEVPRGDALQERLAAVLEVVYLIFNEGYSATAGDDWTRPSLCEEALRLARILAQLSRDTAEVHGLVALLEIQASRMRARLDAEGKPILLMAQDRGRWDQLLIGRGLAALARARTPEATDWGRIVELYGALMACAPSPVVELNRAVAVSMASGPAAALLLVDGLVTDGHLARYHLLHAARGDLLARLERHDEARAEFERAASMTANEREKVLLLERARATGGR